MQTKEEAEQVGQEGSTEGEERERCTPGTGQPYKLSGDKLRCRRRRTTFFYWREMIACRRAHHVISRSSFLIVGCLRVNYGGTNNTAILTFYSVLVHTEKT